MILTCPHCETQYKLSDDRLMPTGHRVKCTQCSHIWLQIPEEKDVSDRTQEFRDIVVDFQEIPESVKPMGQGDVGPLIMSHRPSASSSAGFTGYAAAACVFVVILMGMVKGREAVVHAWPPAYLLYETMGLSIAVPGEGAGFAGLRAEADSPHEDGGENVSVAGRIVNPSGSALDIPIIEASLRSEEGKIIGRRLIHSIQPSVESGQSVDFSADFRGITEKAVDVRLRFLPGGVKTDGEGGGNSPVPPQGDQILPSDAGEAEESPGRVSVQPHPEFSH